MEKTSYNSYCVKIMVSLMIIESELSRDIVFSRKINRSFTSR